MSLLIHASHISKIYGSGESETVALDKVSLEIKKGEFVAIIGASGSGKSTLMNILGCLDRPNEGKYYFEGRLVSSLSEGELSKIRNQKIGFIFQSFNLLPRTSAQANVELPLVYSGVGKKERDERGQKMLERVGLGNKLKSTPAKLSGGEQQRVAIARALVNDPAVIFADEPTGNLDSKTSVEIIDIFKKINSEKKTIVMVTHETDVAKQAKRIITVRDGKILSDTRNKPSKTLSADGKQKGI